LQLVEQRKEFLGIVGVRWDTISYISVSDRGKAIPVGVNDSNYTPVLLIIWLQVVNVMVSAQYGSDVIVSPISRPREELVVMPVSVSELECGQGC
jgi:hypothetical protein